MNEFDAIVCLFLLLKIVPALVAANGSMLPHLTPPEFKKSQDQSSFLIFEGTNLEWQAWPGCVPQGAVSIQNEYVNRRDYVCKCNTSAGFYSPDLGPYCYYGLSGKEERGSAFEILVNKDNFEILEWKEDSWGSVPQNSVRTCSGINVFVGKNKYGLGKVVPQHKAFFLPCKGAEYWYKHYQVLTTSKDVISQDISEVRYKTDGVEVIHHPPETMHKSTITNYECESVVKKENLSGENQMEHRWDIGSATTVGFIGSITAEIPIISSAGIQFSNETIKQFSKETTVVESTTHSVSVQQNVPPNHSCSVSMVAHKYKAVIPFTARLRRTYRNGETRQTSISGTYDSSQIGEVRAAVDRCEPLPDARPETILEKI